MSAPKIVTYTKTFQSWRWRWNIFLSRKETLTLKEYVSQIKTQVNSNIYFRLSTPSSWMGNPFVHWFCTNNPKRYKEILSIQRTITNYTTQYTSEGVLELKTECNESPGVRNLFFAGQIWGQFEAWFNRIPIHVVIYFRYRMYFHLSNNICRTFLFSVCHQHL